MKVKIVNFLGLCGATFMVGLIGLNFLSFGLMGLSIGLFLLLNGSN